MTVLHSALARRPQLGALAALTSLAVLGALAAAPVAHASPDPNRYATPKGSGSSPCAKSDPCGIVKAINDASAGDTIVLLPGTYPDITTTLTDNHENLTIEGAANEPFPVVQVKPAEDGMILTGDTTLQHFELDVSLPYVNGIEGFGATLSHMIVDATGTEDNAVVTHGNVSDSLLIASGTGAAALLEAIPVSSVDTSDTATVRNVTAEAQGPAGTAMVGEDNSLASLTVDAANDIFGGADDGIAVSSDTNASTDVEVDLSYSDSSSDSELAGIGPANINTDQSDIRVAPKFKNAAKGDYREAAGSPTIDAGKSGGVTSSTDLEGFPRTLGRSTDMGAYEFAEKATLKNLSVVKEEKHEARMTVEVNPEGFTTDVRVIATHDGDRIPSHKVTVEDSTGTKKVKLILDGLKAHTKYDVQAVGVNASGTYYSKMESLKTKKA